MELLQYSRSLLSSDYEWILCQMSSMGPQTPHKVSHITLFNTRCLMWDLKLANLF
ncbi:Uncharacterized protein APZ42_026320 [Daphnia magna]|uniref:Uncharacterized protein n=1 Tax=Daphnia magna TaxID=35525 RepID=A0A164SCP6_9CRUS|nr:Uncharacterized protein APZ42_026320 [Daphnia magna]